MFDKDISTDQWGSCAYTSVKSRLLKVGYEHIQYVFFSLDRSTSKVKNIRQYMLTVLYNAPATINQFYDAEVRHDMYWGKDIPDR